MIRSFRGIRVPPLNLDVRMARRRIVRVRGCYRYPVAPGAIRPIRCVRRIRVSFEPGCPSPRREHETSRCYRGRATPAIARTLTRLA